jgi:hypothetical protein
MNSLDSAGGGSPNTVMAPSTELLMLRRALGRALAEEYVDWAVAELCRGDDGPNLRILAGLSPRFERAEVEPCFLLACAELGLSASGADAPALETAGLIRRAFESGELDPHDAIDMMADLYRSGEYQEEVLGPWERMLDELTFGEGYSYPREKLEPLEAAVRREWSLLDRALALSLPRGWLRQTRCANCWHVGHVRLVQPSLFARVLGNIRGKPPRFQVLCERCGSDRQSTLDDPDARAAYFDRLERHRVPSATKR